MPKLVVYDTGRSYTSAVTINFARGARTVPGWQVLYYPIQHYLDHGLEPGLVPGQDAVATLGILRGTGLMLQAAAAAGIDYYYMDHAYFQPGYSGAGWMRIVHNGHSCSTVKPSDPARWKQFFDQDQLLPWRTNSERGDQIIIYPPTNAVSWYLQIPGVWEDTILRKLERLLPVEYHQHITIRYKPNEPIVDDQGNLVKMQKNNTENNLQEDLQNAFCVIAYNSTVALQATLQGIPVIVGDHSCCKPVSFSFNDFKQSSKPKTFDFEPEHREILMHWLANNQWNREEISDGTAWRALKRIVL